ncbi:MAG: hypothetical protein LBU04_01285 [Christensenellaceae bacterium]|jgi:hypothetical protein|nr:hypothetical protein [Christensenellaceae bacterium]
MKCEFCGARLKPDATVCEYCGQSPSNLPVNQTVTSQTANSTETPLNIYQKISAKWAKTTSSRRKARIFFWIMVVIVFVFAVVQPLIYLFANNSSTPDYSDEVPEYEFIYEVQVCYDKIEVGMTFEKVRVILGSNGEFSYKYNDINDYNVEYMIYTWNFLVVYDDYQNYDFPNEYNYKNVTITVTFLDDLVYSKAVSGL